MVVVGIFANLNQPSPIGVFNVKKLEKAESTLLFHVSPVHRKTVNLPLIHFTIQHSPFHIWMASEKSAVATKSRSTKPIRA